MKSYILSFPMSKLEEMFPNRRIKQVDLDGLKLGLARVKNDFYAFESTCPYRLTSLIPGEISDSKEVICPLHSYRFDLKSGAVKAGMCRDLKVYPVEMDKAGLKISIPDISS